MSKFYTLPENVEKMIANQNKLVSKLAEIDQFQKVVAKITETLEVSFDDEEIEQANSVIVQRLLQTEKVQVLLNAMVLIKEIV